MSIGEAIRKFREAKDLKQGQLAYKAGLSKGAINKIESGHTKQPKAETLAKIAAALELSPDDILSEAGLSRTRRNPSRLGPMEHKLLGVIRSIPSPNIRTKTLELAIGFATVARDADLARQPVPLVAEEHEEYEDKEGLE